MIDRIWLFVPACFALNMAIGPNNLLAIANGARHGARAAALATLGRLPAFAFLISLSAIGLAEILTGSEPLFLAAKLLGATYLIFLGVKSMLFADPATHGIEPRHTSQLWSQEFKLALSNPKAILIFAAFFPQFVDSDTFVANYALLGLIFLMLELVAGLIYALLGAHFVGSRRGPSLHQISRLCGVMLVGFGLILVGTAPTS